MYIYSRGRVYNFVDTIKKINIFDSDMQYKKNALDICIDKIESTHPPRRDENKNHQTVKLLSNLSANHQLSLLKRVMAGKGYVNFAHVGGVKPGRGSGLKKKHSHKTPDCSFLGPTRDTAFKRAAVKANQQARIRATNSRGGDVPDLSKNSVTDGSVSELRTIFGKITQLTKEVNSKLEQFKGEFELLAAESARIMTRMDRWNPDLVDLGCREFRVVQAVVTADTAREETAGYDDAADFIDEDEF